MSTGWSSRFMSCSFCKLKATLCFACCLGLSLCQGWCYLELGSSGSGRWQEQPRTVPSIMSELKGQEIRVFFEAVFLDISQLHSKNSVLTELGVPESSSIARLRLVAPGLCSYIASCCGGATSTHEGTPLGTTRSLQVMYAATYITYLALVAAFFRWQCVSLCSMALCVDLSSSLKAFLTKHIWSLLHVFHCGKWKSWKVAASTKALGRSFLVSSGLKPKIPEVLNQTFLSDISEATEIPDITIVEGGDWKLQPLWLDWLRGWKHEGTVLWGTRQAGFHQGRMVEVPNLDDLAARHPSYWIPLTFQQCQVQVPTWSRFVRQNFQQHSNSQGLEYFLTTNSLVSLVWDSILGQAPVSIDGFEILPDWDTWRTKCLQRQSPTWRDAASRIRGCDLIEDRNTTSKRLDRKALPT